MSTHVTEVWREVGWGEISFCQTLPPTWPLLEPQETLPGSPLLQEAQAATTNNTH